MTLIEESNDTTLEKMSYLNNYNLQNISKIKKKHDSGSIESILNCHTEDNIPNKSIEVSNESIIKKKKLKSNEIADVSFESINYINDEYKDNQKPKKKKKHKHFVPSTSNFSKDSNVLMNPVEESNDIILERNSYLNKDLEIQKSKKKRKHDRKSVEYNFNHSAEVNIPNKSIKEYNKSIIKRKEIPNNSFESNNYIKDEHKYNQKLKKKKKLRKSIPSTFNCSTDPNVYKNLVDEFDDNMIKKKKLEVNKLTQTALKCNRYVNDDDINIQKSKKKKKCDRSSNASTSNYSEYSYVSINPVEKFNDTTLEGTSDLIKELEIQKSQKKTEYDRKSIEYIFNYSTEANISNNSIVELNENVIKKNKLKCRDIMDNLSESNNVVNDGDMDTQTPKRKKKHERSSINTIYNYSTDNYASINLVEESNEHLVKKKKHKINGTANSTLESSSNVNDEDMNTQTPKKKKNHDRSSIDANSNYSTDTYASKNPVGESTENLVKKKKHKINETGNTTLESNSNVNDVDMKTQTPKKKKNHDRSSIDDISNYRTDTYASKNLVEESNDINHKTGIAKNIQSLQQNVIEPIDIDDTFKKRSINMNKSTSNDNNSHIKSEYGSEFVYSIPQEKKVIKDILQAINLYKLENLSTNEDKINLGEYNLIDRVLKSNPSVYNHKDSEFILSTFSTFMKSSINLESQVVTHSDIILLESIGKHILEKIIDAYVKSKIIENDLHIELPPECQNNKIHYLETGLTSQLDKKKINLIYQLNPAFKSGRFSKEEDNIIHKYWSKFKEEYNILDPGPFLTIRGRGLTKITLPNKIKLQFIRYISVELPNRLLSCVYNRFNVLYRNLVNKLSFSEEEDEIIMLVDSCDAIKNKFAVLSFLLNRYRELIYKRNISLKMKPLRGDYIFWDIYKLQKLFTAILLETNTKNWNDLKDIKINRDTWKKISKHFDDTINHEKCQTQWNFLKTRLFCKTSIKYSTFKVIVLELLLKINPQHWSDLNWVKITKKLYPGASSKVINTIFHWWITRKVPLELRQDVRGTLNYLETNCLDSEKEKVKAKKEKELSRLTVEDKDVLVEVK